MKKASPSLNATMSTTASLQSPALNRTMLSSPRTVAGSPVSTFNKTHVFSRVEEPVMLNDSVNALNYTSASLANNSYGKLLSQSKVKIIF